MNIIKANLKFTTPLIPLDLNKILYIVLHHPAAITATPEQIHQWHLQNGWSGAGYNYYVRKDGTVYEMRGNNTGAQCLNYNSVSVGICCEGNYDIETTMPTAQFNSTVELIRQIRPNYPSLKSIVGHTQLVSTSCPGKNFPTYKIIDRVNNPFADLETAINVFKAKGIIDSPDYWLTNIKAGKPLKPQYVSALIVKTAKKL